MRRVLRKYFRSCVVSSGEEASLITVLWYNISMKPVITLGALLWCAFLLPTLDAEARSVVRVEDAVSVPSEAVADGDLYGVGSEAVVSGSVTGDFYSAVGELTITGTVASDTVALAGMVDVSGTVGDDLRIIADSVTISGTVEGDVFVIGRKLSVLSEATIKGDVIFFGQEGVIAGTVGNDVLGRVTDLRVDGPVAGMVDVTVGSLTLGDRAAVSGDVRYESAVTLVRAPAAVVSGAVVQADGEAPDPYAYLKGVAETVLVLLFAVLSWYLLLRRNLEQVTEAASRSFVRAGLLGAAVFLVTPFVMGILVASQLGVLVGVLLFVLYVLVIVLAAVGAIAVTGEMVRRFLRPQQRFGLLYIVLGAALVGLCLSLPALAAIPLLLVFLITLGALADRIYHALR